MAKSRPEYITIKLVRGSNGLGFNIRGGMDQPHLPNDNGVFVTKVRDNGSAAKDGRLKEGDKILEINGNSLVNVRHTAAVDHFINAGENVDLRVWSNAERQLVEEYALMRNRGRGFSKFKMFLVIAGLASMIGAIYYVRTKQSARL